MENIMKPKIIIWGYPLHTHTHSYIHAMWVKVFQHLKHEVHWFDDTNFPLDFDFNNCIFITEGYADKNIPLNNTSSYFVHIAVNPQKYLNVGAKLVDIRFNVDHINDLNYSYTTDRASLEKLGNCEYFLQNADDSILADQFRSGVSGYSALYLSWATDKLPHEIDLDDRFIKRENVFYYIGTIGESNVKELQRLNQALQEFNVPFYQVDPWKSPVSFEEGRSLIQKSLIAPDIRGGLTRKDINGKPDTGANHKQNGYIPCRTFKNISYGQLGATNSLAVKNLFGDLIVYSDDEYQLAHLAREKASDLNYIREQMLYVKDNHTFVNRANAILEAFKRIN